MQLYFIRHGQSMNNAHWQEPAYKESPDPALTEAGIEQARLLAEYLERSQLVTKTEGWDIHNRYGFGITHIYASLMERAVHTAAPTARKLGVPFAAWEEIHESGGIFGRDGELKLQGLPGKPRAWFEANVPEFALPASLNGTGWWNSRPHEKEEEAVQIGQVVFRNLDSNITSIAFGLGQAGPVFVSTSTLTINGPSISSATQGPGGAGEVNIQAATISLTGGATINSATLGSGPGGIVSVTASEQLSISGPSGRSLIAGSGSVIVLNNPSAISATTFGTGKAGALTVSTPRLTMFDDGIITTATGSDGPAGSITVNAGSITVSSGASISSSSGFDVGVGGFRFGNGAGGTVTVNATGPVTIADQGSGLFTNTVGTGAGGNIHLRGSAIQLINGASLSATSTGRGNAGNLTVNAGNQFTMMNSSVTTEAIQASGGAIKITTNPNGTVQLTDSTISASVLDDTGGGGSVDIDPQFVILQNSQILAQATQGPGGNISITTNLLLPDANSTISASSQTGVNGTITIQSPNAPVSGQILPLGATPLLATSLLNQHCVALAGGQFSSFTAAGRDSLPTQVSQLFRHLASC